MSNMQLIAVAVIAITSITGYAYASNDSTSGDSLDVSIPAFKNLKGDAIREAEAGQQIVVTHSVHNNVYPEAISLISIMEIRDQDGVTQFLAWQSAKISPNDATTIGISWIVPGDSANNSVYSARVFEITSFGEGAAPLSAVVESEISVA